VADGRAGVRDLVIAGDVGGVRAWLDAGGDPDQTDPATNQTLLMAAAFEGRLEVVRLLLGRGAGREGALFAAVLGRRGEATGRSARPCPRRTRSWAACSGRRGGRPSVSQTPDHPPRPARCSPEAGRAAERCR